MSDPAQNIVPIPKRYDGGLMSIRDMQEREPVKTWYSGYPEWRGKIALAPRMLSVATGHPGAGKSSLFGNIWFNTATTHDLNIAVATFENHPIPSYRKKLREFWAGMPERKMDDKAKREADDFIHDHYRFIIHPQERPTLDFILEYAGKANCDVLMIDPWNRLESQRGKDETETEYVAYCLREMHLFAVSNNCHVMIVAHPAKRDPKFRDRVPYLEDVSGSKNWDNMPDQGFVVHRKKFWDAETNQRQYDCQLYHLKAREEELGYPCCVNMRLNPETCRFEMQ
jgi:twinkle protein